MIIGFLILLALVRNLVDLRELHDLVDLRELHNLVDLRKLRGSNYPSIQYIQKQLRLIKIHI